MTSSPAKVFWLVGFLVLTFCSHGDCAEATKTKLAPFEKQALEKFRPMVKNALYRDYMNEDYYLVTFLRAKEMQMEDAAQLLREAHKWRIENKIDGILKEDMSKLQKSFKYFTGVNDYEGRPVIAWDFGRWDIRRMSLSGSMNHLVRYLDRILEEGVTNVRAQRNATGKDITQYVIIIDGYGFSLRTHGCLSCMPFYIAFITHTDMYYPNTGHAVHMINVPRVFDNVLNLIRPVMSPHIRDTMHLYGFDSNEWKKSLSKLMPTSQLPKQFGGTKENDI